MNLITHESFILSLVILLYFLLLRKLGDNLSSNTYILVSVSAGKEAETAEWIQRMGKIENSIFCLWSILSQFDKR